MPKISQKKESGENNSEGKEEKNEQVVKEISFKLFNKLFY